ncbi:hypothetical protein [Acinetobacter soli]|uniref:hypothetical protein n=1 Tax=Acinetobacter soli TaxID=487316 RepID=UPI000E6AAEBD|nr:hypothetical protein [Acinetobacter soli]
MDLIEAKKNLETYRMNLRRLENYDHQYSTHKFKTECEREIKTLRERIGNLEDALSKAAKRNKKVAVCTMRWS